MFSFSSKTLQKCIFSCFNRKKISIFSSKTKIRKKKWKVIFPFFAKTACVEEKRKCETICIRLSHLIPSLSHTHTYVTRPQVAYVRVRNCSSKVLNWRKDKNSLFCTNMFTKCVTSKGQLKKLESTTYFFESEPGAITWIWYAPHFHFHEVVLCILQKHFLTHPVVLGVRTHTKDNQKSLNGQFFSFSHKMGDE